MIGTEYSILAVEVAACNGEEYWGEVDLIQLLASAIVSCHRGSADESFWID